MTAVSKSRSSLHKAKCDFNNPVYNKIFIYRFQLYKPSSLTAQYTSEKLIAK